MNALEQVLAFTARLREERIHFAMGSYRDSIMVTIPSPSKYLEAEFFSDGRIEIQAFGPADNVTEISLSQLMEMAVKEVNG